MNKQKDPSFKPHYWLLSIQTESAILRKCTRKIRNVGNSSMSTTIRCWLSVDLIKMFFFLLFVSEKKLQNVLCCISSTEAVLVTVKRPLCTDLHLFVCWMLTEILFICERIVLYPVERFHRQKKCLLCSASCSWQSIHDKTSSRTQISAGGYCNKRHAEKKCLCAFSPLRQK